MKNESTWPGGITGRDDIGGDEWRWATDGITLLRKGNDGVFREVTKDDIEPLAQNIESMLRSEGIK